MVEGSPASLKDMAGDRAVVQHVEQVALGGHARQLGRGHPVALALEQAQDLAGGGGLAAFMQVPLTRISGALIGQAVLPGQRHPGDVGRYPVDQGHAEHAHAQRLAEVGVGRDAAARSRRPC